MMINNWVEGMVGGFAGDALVGGWMKICIRNHQSNDIVGIIYNLNVWMKILYMFSQIKYSL